MTTPLSPKTLLAKILPNPARLVTSSLIRLNILVFLLMCLWGIDPISPTVYELYQWGGNVRGATLEGEYWRLVTNIFLHGGLLHLAMNMYGLHVASMFIEPLFGRINTGILYLTSGISGSLASVFWHENTVSIGASGAIFGLFGAIMALLLTDVFKPESRQAVFKMFAPYIGLSLLLGLNEGIDNAAHIGGFLTGALSALTIYIVLRKRTSNN